MAVVDFIQLPLDKIKPIEFKDKGRKYKALGHLYIDDVEANIMIVGMKGSGKTNVILFIMQKCLGKNSKVFIFCNTAGIDDSWKYITKWAQDNGHSVIENRSIYARNPNKPNSFTNLIDDLTTALKNKFDKDNGKNDSSSDEDEEEAQSTTESKRTTVVEQPKLVDETEVQDSKLNEIYSLWGNPNTQDIDVDPKLNEIANVWSGGSMEVPVREVPVQNNPEQKRGTEKIEHIVNEEPTKKPKKVKEYKYKIQTVTEGSKVNKYKTVPYMTIFDDISNELADASIMEWAKENRHFHSKNIFSSQSYVDISKKTRGQMQVLILFAGLTEKLPIIYQEQGIRIPWDIFRKLYKYATNDKYSFLYVDSANNDYRKNFNIKLDGSGRYY